MILLFEYNDNLAYRSGVENNVEVLRRLLPEKLYEHIVFVPEYINFLFIDKTPLNVEQIAIATHNDPILKLVLEYVMNGWPDDSPEFLRPFKVRKHEISAKHNCLF